jgi:hypothetical protein
MKVENDKGQKSKSTDLGSKVQKAGTAQEALGCGLSLRGSDAMLQWQNAKKSNCSGKVPIK